jgi:hypothetical protein
MAEECTISKDESCLGDSVRERNESTDTNSTLEREARGEALQRQEEAVPARKAIIA